MDALGLRTLPFLSRRNYYYELKHIVPWGLLVGLVEGQFASIVIARSFEGSARLIAIASATPAAAFLFSLFWGMLCVGRPKVRLLTLFTSGMTLLVGLVAIIPPTPMGAVWFLCQMAGAQVLLSGVVTVRSAVWKSNYPRSDRGRITAKLQAIRFSASVVAALVGAGICDRDPTAYRYIYPTAALFGAIGVVLLQRLHIRGERRELRRHERPSDDPIPRTGLAEPFSLTALLSPGHVFGRMVHVLRADRRFAQYLIAQSFIGVGNFMTIPVAVAVVTQGLNLGMAWGFWISTGLLQAIPQLVRLVSIGRWARLFDRMGVVQFRVYNISCWTFAMLFGLLGTLVAEYAEWFGAAFLPLAVGCFALRGLASGTGLGGGSLAWNIGHLHFAKTEEAEIYMGIHVFLTGLRGLIAPLLGMWLYLIIGWWVWLISLTLSICSVSLYVYMARKEKEAGTDSSARSV